MPEDYEGFPQRRDFPVGGEPVLFTYNETDGLRDGPMSRSERLPQARRVDHDVDRVGGHGRDPRAADAQHRPAPPGHARRAAADRDARGRGRPRHQADHRLRPHRHREDRRAEVLLEGDPRRSSGWITCSYYFNAMAYCGAVETLLGIEVPPRAQYLRVLHLELNRIMSHLVWLGTSALDLGAMSMFWYCFRERETILDLFEMSSGQRMHTRYFQIGGVIEDIPVGFAEKVQKFVDDDADPRRPVRRPAREERDPALAPARHLHPRRAETLLGLERHRAAAARRRRPLGPAQGGARTRATTTSTSRSRSAPSATTTTASASATPSSTSRPRSSSRRSTACPRARTSPMTARSCCRRATSWRPAWRR